ncbi:hypothetical protein BJP40_12030 [Streptomyces sp. CC53]|uniref:hypothetical protein n=1 Tax=Streptomyces sp. CC53 TaxID=1906740 RepID=UPI0008DD2891|nr:hypothetical protein [Streptomyces sp. CC53]OII59992.1 hypothetical protein BJP40_12030 [Streptomyces sp. CC53]
MDDVTNADRAAWAAEALAAYNDASPDRLLPVPETAERVRLGTIAAEALARATRRNPREHTVTDEESAHEVIGDLFAYAFLLADGRATPGQLTRAAEEMRSTAYPVTLNAVCEVAAADVERVAAMLAACMDAAEHFGCDVPRMLENARRWAETTKAEEACTAV